LNPLSQFHLSVRVDYPNREDIAHASAPRDQLGGDIYIHGNKVSIGCIAIGDPAIERVFCLAALASPSWRRILISPRDFRRADPAAVNQDPWIGDLYRRLDRRLEEFPNPVREADR
jgi:murein L,D-transpeptidase YafK